MMIGLLFLIAIVAVGLLGVAVLKTVMES